MPRKKKGDEGVDIRVRIPGQKTATESPTEAPPEIPLDKETAAAVKRDIDAIAREAGEGATAKIERTDPRNGKVYFCGQFPARLVTKQFCVERFGGGEFYIEVSVPNASGSTQWARRVRFSIDPSVQPLIATAAAAPGAPGALGMEAMQGFLTQQLESAAAYHRLNMEMLKSAGRPGFEWIVPFLPVIVEVVKGFYNRRPGRDPMEIALKWLHEMQPEAASGGGLDEVLGQVETIEKLRRVLGGGNAETGEGDRVFGIMDRGISVFEKLMAERARSGVTAGRRRLAAAEGALPNNGAPPIVEEPATDPGPAADPAPEVIVKLNTLWARELAKQLSDVPRFARMVPPEAAGAIVFENMSPAAFEELGAELSNVSMQSGGSREGALARIAKWRDSKLPFLVQPGWAPEVAEWFSDALFDLAVRFTEDDDEGPEVSPITAVPGTGAPAP